MLALFVEFFLSGTGDKYLEWKFRLGSATAVKRAYSRLAQYQAVYRTARLGLVYAATLTFWHEL